VPSLLERINVIIIQVGRRSKIDDQKSIFVGDIGRPNRHVGDETIWPANVADLPINLNHIGDVDLFRDPIR
jgi:hypothetical protein